MTVAYPQVDPRVARWMSHRGQGLRLSAAAAVILRRPTVALDDSSLAVDERLRALDAALALTPWFCIDVAMVGGLPGGPIGAADTLILLASLPVVALTAAWLAQPANERWRR